MKHVLLISDNHQLIHMIKELCIYQDVTVIKTCDRAHLYPRVDLYILDMKASNRQDIDFAKRLVYQTGSQVLLLINHEEYDRISYDLQQNGIYTLLKPYSRMVLMHTLRMCEVSYRHIKTLQNEKEKLIDELNEIKLINKAKWLLVERKQLTEKQAHHYIEKKAMDLRVKKKEVAKKIIDFYS